MAKTPNKKPVKETKNISDLIEKIDQLIFEHIEMNSFHRRLLDIEQKIKEFEQANDKKSFIKKLFNK